MAWTTSASLRARPLGWDQLAATRFKTARFTLAWLRRSFYRCHPGYAFALPLAGLGLLTPLLPLTVTAALLLAAGATLGLHSAHAQRTRKALAALACRAHVVPHYTATAGHDAAETEPPHAPHLALAWQAQRMAGLAPAAWRLRVAEERKKQTDKDWADLMARVNHDLRTPLNAVIGFSELMALELFGPLGDHRYQDYVHHIRDSATDLLKSAEDTLTLTALIAGSRKNREAQSCDLETLAADAWAFVSRRATGRAISFDPNIAADLEILGEPRMLRQVLVNVLSEAIARAARGERVILTAETEGELIELSVTVSKERSQNAHKGNSLAICLARTLLEMQGTSLLEIDTPSQGWRAVTVLDRAAQADFFTPGITSSQHDKVTALAS
jgi:signal transduction histidine kinase